MIEIPEFKDRGQTLSVAMIVWNEEAMIREALESVSFADEIVLGIDSKTNDRTREIAGEFPNVKMYEFEWSGNFSQARNIGLKKCIMDWVLILDADERITDPNGIKSLINSDGDAYMIMQLTEFSDMISSCVTTRLWRNHLGIKYNEDYEKHETACGSILAQGLKLERVAYGFRHIYKEHESDAKNQRIIEGIEGKNHPNGNFYLGQSYSNLGNHPKAIEYLLKALNDPIDNSMKAFCCNLISQIYFGVAQANTVAAIDFAKHSLGYAPNQNVAHVMLGNVLEFNGQKDEALKEFKQGLNNNILRTDLHHDIIFKNLQERIKEKEK